MMQLGRIGKLHFGLIAFLLVHFLFSVTTGLSLEAGLLFAAKLIAFLTGIVLFFKLWGKRTFIKYYAGIYIFAPLLVFVGYLIDGILGAILGSVLLLFIYLPESVVKDGAYEVRTEFAGLMNPCCFYALYENKYLLFERKITRFMVEGPASEIQKLKVSPSRVSAVIYYTTESNSTAQVLVNLPPH